MSEPQLLLNAAWLARAAEAPCLWVGLSGGLDSTVLLHALLQQVALRPKLRVIHFNHGLSPHAAAWEAHCRAVAAAADLPFVVESLIFDKTRNVEAQARAARYASWAKHLQKNEFAIVGHHRQDQAETLLLNLLRGAGVDGCAAMPVMRSLGVGWLCRPLLHQDKAALRAYAVRQALSWVEDESNLDTRFSRNYLRQVIVPQLETHWPDATQRLALYAEHLQTTKYHLDALAKQDGVLEQTTLSLETLAALSLERQQNALRYWLKINQINPPSAACLLQMVKTMVQAKPDAMPCMRIGTVDIRRYRQQLYVVPPIEKPRNEKLEWLSFPAAYMAYGYRLEGVLTQTKGLLLPKDAKIYIAYRQGGERLIWRGQTKTLKHLWQIWGVPPWLRDQIPLLYVDHVLVAVIGYALGDVYYRSQGEALYDVQCTLEVRRSIE